MVGAMYSPELYTGKTRRRYFVVEKKNWYNKLTFLCLFLKIYTVLFFCYRFFSAATYTSDQKIRNISCQLLNLRLCHLSDIQLMSYWGILLKCLDLIYFIFQFAKCLNAYEKCACPALVVKSGTERRISN